MPNSSAPRLHTQTQLTRVPKNFHNLTPMEAMAALAALESGAHQVCMSNTTCTTCTLQNHCPFS